MSNKSFTVNVTMEERWIPYFQSFLKYMQSMGSMGHSCKVAFYCDGDGDFRPQFEFDTPFEKVEGITRSQMLEAHKDDAYRLNIAPCLVPEIMFDAG